MSGYYEREQYGAGQGQYSNIEREQWQQITFQAGVMVPAGQALLIAVSWGFVVGLAAGFVCHFAGWPVLYGALAGGFSVAVLMAWQASQAIEWMRTAYASREVYQAEKQAGAQVDRATVSIQWHDPKANGGYGQAVFDELSVTPEQLALVAGADRLSKRGLMDVGLNDAQAMRLLAQLLAMGYIVKRAENEPSQWTSKGQAMRRAFTGGGGGGGGVVVDIPTSAQRQVGEGA